MELGEKNNGETDEFGEKNFGESVFLYIFLCCFLKKYGTRNILKYAPIYFKDYQIFIENGQHFEFAITYANPDTNSDTNPDTNPDTNTNIHPVTLSEKQKIVLQLCLEPKSAREILETLGVIYHSKNIKMYIKDLIAYGYLELTIPDNPFNPAQKYVTTEKGKMV